MGLTIRLLMSWIREMTKNIEVVENIDFGVQFNHEVKDLNLQKEILMILLIKKCIFYYYFMGGKGQTLRDNTQPVT